LEIFRFINGISELSIRVVQAFLSLKEDGLPSPDLGGKSHIFEQEGKHRPRPTLSPTKNILDYLGARGILGVKRDDYIASRQLRR
jgi:hypothetical protein